MKNIEEQIATVDQTIDWVKQNLQSGKQLDVFKRLVNIRRQLKRIRHALSEKPAIAAYGESQKGKSYVIGSLLSHTREPFMIKGTDGTEYNFIEQINPIVRNTEATGVVTRFTTSDFMINPSYPVKIKLLSLSDIIIILSDSYFHDVDQYKTLETEDINIFIDRCFEKYRSKLEVEQDYLTEDDIYDIHEFVSKYSAAEARDVLKSRYFDTLAQVIPNIPINEWVTVFSKLWSDDEHITKLFLRLLDGYISVNFTQEVYVPIEAVLNDNNTLMSITCLVGLMRNTAENTFTSILYKGRSGQEQVSRIDKSLLSAMSAEAIYKVEQKYIEGEEYFCFDGLRADTEKEIESIKSYLVEECKWNEPVRKNFLQKNDLLDFPGARSRQMIQVKHIGNDNNIVTILLRGKVSYLFNKYSEERIINILLFCHDYEHSAQTFMPKILSDWVGRYIGENAEKRSVSLKESVVSPLFIIATKFNKDLEMAASTTANQQAGGRWEERFKKVLYDQILGANSFDWFNHWVPGNNFKNVYLLRDFKYSSDKGGESSKLFSGYPERENQEYDVDFRLELKKSFIEDKNIRTFFQEPERSWDSACTLNNDGSLFIISQLSIAAANADKTRRLIFGIDMTNVEERIISVFKEIYHDDNDENLLYENIAKAGMFHSEMDITTGKDSNFFGRMMQKLQINENFVFDFYHDLLHSASLIDNASIKEYDLILKRVEECGLAFDRLKGDNYNLEILRKVYHRPDISSTRSYFEGKHIILKDLFAGTYKRKSSNSFQMSEGIIERWFDELLSTQTALYFTDRGFDGGVLYDFIKNIQSVAAKLSIASIIAKNISEYVDNFAVNADNEEMIADITANICNRFITTLGYDYLQESKIEELKELNKKEHLCLSFNYDEEDVRFSDDELSDLFDSIRPADHNDKGTIECQPFYKCYRKWMDFAFISFMLAYDVPNYDVEANEMLGKIYDAYIHIGE